MRSLRLRVVLVVTIAALAPVIAVSFWARTTVVDRTREQDRRRLDQTVAAAQQHVDEEVARDRRIVERLCDVDLIVDRLLVDLATDRFGPAAQDELVSHLDPMRTSLGLDVLALLDGNPSNRGTVLGSAHYPGRTGAVDNELLGALEAANDGPFIRTIRVRVDGETQQRETILHTCSREQDRAKVWVVGGRFLERATQDLARGDDSIQIRVARPGEASPRDVYTFHDSRGETAARLVATVDESALRAKVRELDRGFLIVGAVSLLLAVIFGLLLALSLSRPLGALEEAAGRVGSGDLESTIGVRSKDEVGRALNAFNQMTRDLKVARNKLRRAERLAAWRDIARRIAHEVKNPLSPIQVSIETMRKTYRKRHPDFEEIFEESTTMILDEVQKLSRLATEFSDFARMPAPRKHAIDTVELVRHTVALWGGDETVHLDVELGEGLPTVQGDRDQLSEVMTNLVKNAIEAARLKRTPGEAVVRIEASMRGEGVELRVEDNGPGVPEAQRHRIFEPYFTTKAEGTGLGLSIVHRIVTEHEGSIHVERAPSGGAAFVVYLTKDGPRVAASASMTDAASSRA